MASAFQETSPKRGRLTPLGERCAHVTSPANGGRGFCLLFYMFPLGKHASRKRAQHRLIL